MVAYPQLGALDRSGFPVGYSAFTSRIGVPVVSMELLAFLSTFLLYAWRPQAVSTLAVHLLVGLGVAYFAITFGWHLPSHRALAAGDNSAEALAPLLESQWARTIVQLLRAGLLAFLSARAMPAG